VSEVSGDLVFCDFETLSRCNIKPAGTHLYAADLTTEIIVFTYSHGGEFHEWTPDRGRCETLVALAADPAITFVAHGSFERILWQTVMVEQFGFPPIPLERWRDTTATCAYNRVPLEPRPRGQGAEVADREGR